ncbi:hypothetical protein HYH02_015367 [Chlamydomonas schloesseri]|uniref:Uncharacterized protein n=1 Tax=Chlamydomonas schloesseri TaxID=2026947 RepID=A0A835SE63_9CHLO|nr:hypothetical protein HYH02_015367 [Chlamydomonas schloesseri]|eukprot:KAG2423077.1 hypothetical protein HYH02_015367 [Chlamydomonas schloesseri]
MTDLCTITREVDFTTKGLVTLCVTVSHLPAASCGSDSATPQLVDKFRATSGGAFERVLGTSFLVSPHTALLGIYNNLYEDSIKSFRDGDQFTVTVLEATTSLAGILNGSITIQHASEQFQGFHIEKAAAKKGPGGVVVKQLDLVVTVISDEQPRVAPVRSFPGNSNEGGTVLADTTAAAYAAANRQPLAGRLSCGSTMDQGLPNAPAVKKTGGGIKKEPAASEQPSAGASRNNQDMPQCPISAAAALRPMNGNYSWSLNRSITWRLMDAGGCLLQSAQSGLVGIGSGMYQKLMGDGLGVARLKDSPAELAKTEWMGSNTGRGAAGKENKTVKARDLSTSDIADANLYAASWMCATGYVMESMLQEGGPYSDYDKLHARYFKHHEAFIADGEPRPNRSSSGGPVIYGAVPNIRVPSDAAPLFKNHGANSISARSKARDSTLERNKVLAADQPFDVVRPHLQKIQAVLDTPMFYKTGYKSRQLAGDLKQKMTEAVDGSSTSKKEETRAVWSHAVYGALAHRGASWAEIGAVMVENGGSVGRYMTEGRKVKEERVGNADEERVEAVVEQAKKPAVMTGGTGKASSKKEKDLDKKKADLEKQVRTELDVLLEGEAEEEEEEQEEEKQKKKTKGGRLGGAARWAMFEFAAAAARMWPPWCLGGAARWAMFEFAAAAARMWPPCGLPHA